MSFLDNHVTQNKLFDHLTGLEIKINITYFHVLWFVLFKLIMVIFGLFTFCTYLSTLIKVTILLKHYSSAEIVVFHISTGFFATLDTGHPSILTLWSSIKLRFLWFLWLLIFNFNVLMLLIFIFDAKKILPNLLSCNCPYQ